MMRNGFNQFFDRGREIGGGRDFGGICGGGFHMGGIGMILGGLVFLAVVALVVILIVALVRKGSHSHYNSGVYSNKFNEKTVESSANVAAVIAILNERYAKGEINQEEYLAKKEDLLK